MHKKELIKFWTSSAFGSGFRNFLKESSTLRDRAFFHNLVYISGDSDQIFIKILSQMHPWRRKFPLNFGSNPRLESGSGVRTPDTDCILLGGRVRSPTGLVVVISILYYCCVSGASSSATFIHALHTNIILYCWQNITIPYGVFNYVDLTNHFNACCDCEWKRYEHSVSHTVFTVHCCFDTQSLF